MDRSELAKLRQKQGTASVDSSTNVDIRNVTPSPAVDVDVQDIYIKGVRSGQRVIKDHALLSHLDFASSGHTGFAGIAFGTVAEWRAIEREYVPEKGVLVVYTDYAYLGNQPVPGFKIGTGNNYLYDLRFVNDDIRQQLDDHINDAVRHITAEERAFWNHKLDVIDPEEGDEILIFTRD